ncbi:hypothetical protein F4777DRAFT_249811 [Nemania sp. FL0916]|nr:hypothetical protein F4777DRAFT_249811 [Nemania sp. FL0916]
MASPGPPPPSHNAAYYKFEDFDRKDVFDKAEPHTQNRHSQNFVVEFGPEHARIAFDLDSADIVALLGAERDMHYPIRWINIWNPGAQEKSVRAIGSHYGFSERLILLMYMSAQLSPKSKARARDRYGISRRFRRHTDVESGGVSKDANGSYALESVSGSPLPKTSIQITDDMEDDNMALYLQVKDTVNYFSTDQTQKGAHWLHKRPDLQPEHQSQSLMPPKHWQWLTLCDDHTVLSIHEQPSFEPAPRKVDVRKWEEKELKNMRDNTLDVLLQLSHQGFDLYKKKPLSLNSVRRPLSKRHERSTVTSLSRNDTGITYIDQDELGSLADEGTSNLFYYLFEDYVAAEPLKMAEGKLEHITTKVLDTTRPKIRNRSGDIIPTLHYLSKDLRELKHLFENYMNLISKITAIGRPDAALLKDQDEEPRKVKLTHTALSRFDRLGDRLQYLMVNSIEGYLGEISAVSSTVRTFENHHQHHRHSYYYSARILIILSLTRIQYFNLTQQKDSEATARLTRSATLLAKLSVFFLPISFLTSYFSVQIEDLYTHWHGTDYWYSFAVIASVSFVSLFFFSRLLMFFSDTLDDWAFQVARWVRRVGRSVFLNRERDEDDDD